MDISGYVHHSSKGSHTNAYLLPVVFEILAKEVPTRRGIRVFDLGCGSGSVAAALSHAGYSVVGVDPSPQGIELANKNFPHLRLELGSTELDLHEKYGQFRFVVSLEVVEHVFAPRKFARCVYQLLEPGGVAIISTPYHGYLKNLALALTGKLDAHFTALWDCGHIKFWSIRTLSELLREAGFVGLCFRRVGRIPVFAKSMVAVARKPVSPG